jgi:hypothetical protein
MGVEVAGLHVDGTCRTMRSLVRWKSDVSVCTWAAGIRREIGFVGSLKSSRQMGGLLNLYLANLLHTVMNCAKPKLCLA